MTTQARDLIMWVGSGSYPTWRAFATEAHAMGVCKRVRTVPRGIISGQSKCFLAHGERVVTQVESLTHGWQKIGLTCRYCGIGFDQHSRNPAPCRLHMLRRVGKPRSFLYGYFVIEEILSATQEVADKTPDRGCGKLNPGAIYLLGPLTEFPEPKPWQGGSYVGFRYYTEMT